MPNLEKIRKLREKMPKIGVLQEFKDFLKEYKVVGIAVAFIMAAAATTLVQSLVNNIIMPLITPFIPKGEWQAATLTLGPFVFGWGSFLGALINFIILAFVVFMIAKMILKEEKVAKK
jgi:large conductance mechanosensitive channel